MTSKLRKPKQCNVCQGTVNDAFLCRRCGRELRELLIGDGTTKPVVESQHPKGQPGIAWYIERLRETAYRQTVMERNLGAHAGRSGYDQLGNRDALDLLAKIHVTLWRWNDQLDRLSGIQSHEQGQVGTIAYPDGFDGLDGLRAARLAENITTLRHHCEDIAALVNDLLGYSKEAWRVVNRPDDICCGACPNMVVDKDDHEVECGVMLYAEEFADDLVCPKCHAKHDVSALRERLKQLARDKLFTGPELLRLMSTRLNDHLPKSSFYALVKDGRLRARGYDNDDAPLYTYDDVCEAREKPRPARRKSA